MAKPIINVRVYYVFPCLLLLLNLANEVVEYQSQRIADPWLRTTVVLGLVLFGASLVAFLFAPALEKLVRWLQKTSRAQAGGLGEALWLIGLGAGVFWLYFRLVNHGIEDLIPVAWQVGGAR
jgi:hypothetical protein